MKKSKVLAIILIVVLFSLSLFEVPAYAATYTPTGDQAKDIVNYGLSRRGEYGDGQCAWFVASCAKKIGMTSKQIKLSARGASPWDAGNQFSFLDANGNPKYGCEAYTWKDFKDGNYTPQTGDLVFFGWFRDGTKGTGSMTIKQEAKKANVMTHQHVAIIRNNKSSKTSLYTIDGGLGSKDKIDIVSRTIDAESGLVKSWSAIDNHDGKKYKVYVLEFIRPNYKTHKHKWDDNGNCTEKDCKKNYYGIDDFKKNMTTVRGKIIGMPGIIKVYKYPYENAPLLETNLTQSSYIVNAKVTNHNPEKFGKDWYRVVLGDNSYGYVLCTRTGAPSLFESFTNAYFEQDPATITVSPKFSIGSSSADKVSAIPASVKKGTSIFLSGAVKSTNADIASVTVGIYKQGTNTVANGSNGTKCEYTNKSVKNATFNLTQVENSGKMAFSKLPAGKYTFRIKVSAEGVTAESNMDFEIKASTSSVPRYTVTLDANGGKLSANTYKTDVMVSKGGSISLGSYVPTNSGSTFLGWSTSGTKSGIVEDSYKPSGSITLYAIWEVDPPQGTPKLMSKTMDIGAGEAATVNWWEVSGASKYLVTFYDGEGNVYTSMETAVTTVTTVLQEPGVYTVTVRAQNSAGETEESTAGEITVHAPVQVTFRGHDGSVYAVQEVSYGGMAVTPAPPSREGYSFTGWSGSLNNLKNDCEVTAQYEPIEYTVVFYDYDGKEASRQIVTYEGDMPGSAVPPDESALGIPLGYALAGWDNNDWQSVTRTNISVYPCVVWGNEDLPIEAGITLVNKEGNGYWVNYYLENHGTLGQSGRVVIALKSGSGKFLTKTESGAFWLNIGDSYSGSLYVPLNEEIREEAFATVEAYVVSSYTDLVPISSMAQWRIGDNENSDWSAWMTADEFETYTGDKSETQTRTEYRSRSKQITDWMTNESYLDWMRYDRRNAFSEWGAWSGWQDTAVTADDYTDVETKQVQTAAAYTMYRYGRYVSTSAGKDSDGDSYPKGWGHFHQKYYNGDNWKLAYTSWSKTKTSPASTNCYVWGSNNSVKSGTLKNGKYYWSKYTVSGTNYYWQETKTVAATYKTQYRYRTRGDIIEYRYYQWSGWSDWSTGEITAYGDQEVQTRTLYRVKIPSEELGEGYTIEGAVNIDGIADLEGRQAILNIYKVDEASDYSNEYIAQGVLGENGTYSFVGIHTYEEPSVKTGDFTVTLTIEGSSGPMVLDTGALFLAPKPEYLVTFVDGMTGEMIGQPQTVVQGGTAMAPSVPDKEGYVFLGWEYGLTNIRDDMVIKARFVEKTYTVVYVDFVNSTVGMQIDVPYGTALEIGDPPEAEGYTFVGWKAENGGNVDFVDRSMIVTAQYERISYTVRFMDSEGNVIHEETVQYGDSVVEVPDLLDTEENEDLYVLDWSSDEYETVTSSLEIWPVMVCLSSAEPVETSLEPGIYEGPQIIELACDSEDATISYRLVTAGDEESSVSEMIYTEPIVLTQSAVLEVTSSAEGINSVTDTYEYVIVPFGSRPFAPATLTAEADTDSIALSWSVVDGADGYIVTRTDIYDNVNQYLCDTASYIDVDVESVTDYIYTVQAYKTYVEGESEELLISEDASTTAEIRYFGDQYAVEEIRIITPETMSVGDTVLFGTEVLPEDAYDPDVLWYVENGTGRATITSGGLFTALSAGTVSVTAMALDGSNVRATHEVNITEAAIDGTILRVGSANAVEGQTVTIPVSIMRAGNIATLQFSLLYDSTLLSLDDVTFGTGFDGNEPDIDSTESGVILFSWDVADAVMEDGLLMNISFTAQNVDRSTDTMILIPNSVENDDYEFVCTTPDQQVIDASVVIGTVLIDTLRLDNLPAVDDLTLADKDMVYAAKAAYDAMSEEEKAALDPVDVKNLELAVATIEKLEAQAEAELNQAMRDALKEQLAELQRQLDAVKEQLAKTPGWHQNEDGTKYFCDANGEKTKGWLSDGGKWYFLDKESGIMQKGWLKDGGRWYFLDKDTGAMATGWVKDGDNWYYMAASGAMTTGWVKVGNSWYYMKSSGAMAASEWCDGYWLNANGTWTYQPRGSWKSNSTGWWFGDTSGWYAKNETLKINDVLYTFNEAGYWLE